MFAKRVGEGGLGLGFGCARGKGEKVVRVHEAFGRWLGNDVASETDRQNSQRRGGGIPTPKQRRLPRKVLWLFGEGVTYDGFEVLSERIYVSLPLQMRPRLVRGPMVFENTNRKVALTLLPVSRPERMPHCSFLKRYNF